MRRLARSLLVAIALGAGLASLGAGLALQLGRWSGRLDVANHFAPWVLLATLALAGIAFAAGRRAARRAGVALASAGALLCAVQVVPEAASGWLQPRAKAPAKTLKIVQFNLWVENKAPQRTLDWILAQKADIVVVEEAGAAARPIRAGLRAAYGEGASCRRRCTTVVFSRLPLLERGRLASPQGSWARYRWNGRAVTVVGTHFYWPYPAGEQQRQGRALAEFLQRQPRRDLILTGDFNAAPWSFSLKRQTRAYGLRRLTHGLTTWPARPFAVEAHESPTQERVALSPPFPFLAIDQVFAGEGWSVVSVKRGPRLGSDHYPVVVELAPR